MDKKSIIDMAQGAVVERIDYEIESADLRYTGEDFFINLEGEKSE